MTIYTSESALTSEKKDLMDTSVEVDVQCPEKKALAQDEVDAEYAVYNDPVVPLAVRRQPRPAKRRICLQLCLFAGIVLGLTVSMLASMYLYRTMTRLKYKGRCGVGLVPVKARNITSQLVTASALTDNRGSYMMEDIEIDDYVEMITVPEVEHYQPATIRHDFMNNVTDLKDHVRSLCYRLPLLPDHLVPDPHRFYDALRSREAESGALFDSYPLYNAHYMLQEAQEELRDSMKSFCEDYVPFVGQPMMTTMTSTTTESMLIESTVSYNWVRNFLEYAGGDSSIAYSIKYPSDI